MMSQQLRSGDFSGLAAAYDRFRIGYSSALFDLLETVGVRRGKHVLDAGCGTGLSTGPLVTRGMSLTGIDPSAEMLAAATTNVPEATFVQGSVEQLPFGDKQFDAAVCAQAFHWFDGDVAFAELIRVVKPGGVVAVWWKMLGSDDPIRSLRRSASSTAGVEPTSDPLKGGFGAFYRASFAARTLRVIPFVARLSVDEWLGYERSRASARDAHGGRQDAYLEALRGELLGAYGSLEARMDVRYSQYLYIGNVAP